MLSKLIGVPAAGLGKLLEPIQSYCLLPNKSLPPLTVLVVQQESGLPGSGYTGSKAEEFARNLMLVFDYDWFSHGNPQAEQLQKAVEKLPSNGEKC